MNINMNLLVFIKPQAIRTRNPVIIIFYIYH